MSQIVGQNFKTRIPQFSDDASIEEALKVYHYGVDNYTVQPIPDDSIEGHFRNLDTRVDSLESQIGGIASGIVKYTSLSADPNIIVAETTTTVPLTVRAIASQSSALQAWQNSSSSTVATISTGGYISTLSYIGIATLTATSSIAANINIISSGHKGIVVKAANSQTANLQEWQNSTGAIISVINASGSFSSAGYLSAGSATISTTTSLFTNTLNASHKGIVVKAFSGQTANLQEWQNSDGGVMARVDNTGTIYSKDGEVQTINSLLLIGA